MPTICNFDFILVADRIIMALLQCRRITMEKSLERTDERNQLTRLVEWLAESFERAQTRDHDRYVAEAANPREVSQRLHRIEQGEESFHA
jgi:hypothetical protein